MLSAQKTFQIAGLLLNFIKVLTREWKSLSMVCQCFTIELHCESSNHTEIHNEKHIHEFMSYGYFWYKIICSHYSSYICTCLYSCMYFKCTFHANISHTFYTCLYSSYVYMYHKNVIIKSGLYNLLNSYQHKHLVAIWFCFTL